MKARVQGTEHEYTLYNRYMMERGIDPHELALELLSKSELYCAGDFVANQSRIYLDCGHFEVSTCETTNFRDLLRWEKAGEKILDWLRKVIEERYLSEGRQLLAFKNNTAPDGTSYGSHENYCVPRSLSFPEDFVRYLAPHLITRIIYTGAGDILDNRYVLSPSAYLTSKMVSDHTMHGTGVINTRDEAHADASRFRRLHLQIGDALMNEVAIALRQFTTSAVLQLMEEGKLEDVPVLTSPLEDMWNMVESTNPDRWVFHTAEGEATPMEIQRYYLSKAEELVESGEERRIFRMWEEVLELLERRDTRALARRIDWLGRYISIQEELKRHPDAGPDLEMRACKGYSEISLGRSLFYKRMRRGLVDRFLSDEDIISAITSPPEDTRAWARHLICEEHDVAQIDWSFVRVREDDGTLRTITLEDPMSNEV